jgi:diadenylate cyclase
MLRFLPTLRFADVLDILVVAFIIYWILLFIRGTRAVQMLYGLLLMLAMFVLSKKLGMVTFQWLVGNIFGRVPASPPPNLLDELVQCTFRLAADRIGAIFLLEREMGLQEYVEHGKKLDAIFSHELLASILSTRSPVHDGAVVIRGDRVAAAGVILPIPAESSVVKTMGTRHRAGWGVCKETDAVSIVISEETGKVTVFHDRQMESSDSAMELKDILVKLFTTGGGESGSGN